MHQGSMFSSQWLNTFSPLSGMIFTSPSRTASSAGPAIFSASTYHWSVSIGSITTFERSPNGCMIFLFSTNGTVSVTSTFSPSSFFSVRVTSCITARPSAVMSATTRVRASNRSTPRYSSGTMFIATIIASSNSSSSLAMAWAVVASST